MSIQIIIENIKQKKENIEQKRVEILLLKEEIETFIYSFSKEFTNELEAMSIKETHSFIFDYYWKIGNIPGIAKVIKAVSRKIIGKIPNLEKAITYKCSKCNNTFDVLVSSWEGIKFCKKYPPECKNCNPIKHVVKNWYEEYLQTPHWQELRKKIFERSHGICEKCKQVKMVDVHHLSYERIGKENLEDLLAVCEDCHNQFHDIVEDKDDI